MNLPDNFTESIDIISQKLLESVSPELADSLREPIHYFLKMPGKKIRPLMTLLSSTAVGGTQDMAVSAATAIELFHDFTLIHDDIMDKDEKRRGFPTLHIKFGEDTAILAGDTLIGLAYTQLLNSPAVYIPQLVRIFTEALVKVSDGQALDKEFETRQDVGKDEYLEMIAKKTAWLFKDACKLGAICGGGDAKAVAALEHFGHCIGMGFQIQDDLLDLVADESKLGKKVGSDFLLDKKTYVALAYREHIASHPDLQSKYPRRINQFNSLQELQRALTDVGLIQQIQALCDQYIKEALQSLAVVQPLDENNDLFQLTQFLQHRQF